jgi:reactive intermediate/imine deaminase
MTVTRLRFSGAGFYQGDTMSVRRYSVAGAPAPVTPYSHAVESDNVIYVTGQIGNDPLHPQTKLPRGIDAQTRQVFQNLHVVLAAVGATFEEVLFARIYLRHFKRDYAAFNQLYNQVFSDQRKLPARTTIGVSHLARNAIVEVDLVVRRADDFGTL